MMPGWLLPSRSNCPSWRRLSSKCKEGLGFGVCFHQVSACCLWITSSSRRSFAHLPKGERCFVNNHTLFWFEQSERRVKRCSQARLTKGQRFRVAAFCARWPPGESLGSQRSSLSVWLNKLGSLWFKAVNPVIKWSVASKESLRRITYMVNSLRAASAVGGEYLCPLSGNTEGVHMLFFEPLIKYWLLNRLWDREILAFIISSTRDLSVTRADLLAVSSGPWPLSIKIRRLVLPPEGMLWFHFLM